MILKFTKMHGLGNDFMVIDLVSQYLKLRPEQIRRWGNRHTGVGFDQLLVVEPPQSPNADFRYRIYNADGGEVEQCGNGARCFARFVQDKKLTKKSQLRVETNTGLITLDIRGKNEVSVNMGIPILTPSDIPFLPDNGDQEADSYTLHVGDQTLDINAVSMGNPHAVWRVDDVEAAPVLELGPQIEHHPSFPQRVNAGFMQVVSPEEIRLRVFERGVGETQACGSGACAAVVAGRLRGWLDDTVTTRLLGGNLTIEWQGRGHPVIMTGPCTRVYEGRLFI